MSLVKPLRETLHNTFYTLISVLRDFLIKKGYFLYCNSDSSDRKANFGLFG